MNTTRRLARAITVPNSRRSSCRRSRLRSAWVMARSRTARSNMGSGRERLGNAPSTAPLTSTVSNSRPTVPCAVSTWTASVRARSHAEWPGPCSPASSDSRNACTLLSPPPASVSATTFANVTTVSRSRLASASVAARSTSRLEHGSCSHRCRNESCTLMPANNDALVSVSRAAVTLDSSSGVSPSWTSSTAAGDPSWVRAALNAPRATAGENPTTSEVTSCSASSSRWASSATNQRRASTYGRVAGSELRDRPRSGMARGIRASSSARRSPPRWEPWRRTTTARSDHATPSSTCVRRSSRAIEACSSEVWGATQASMLTDAPRVRCVVVSSIAEEPGKVRPNRSSGTELVPWNENTCACGSAAITVSGARRPATMASPARVVSW